MAAGAPEQLLDEAFAFTHGIRAINCYCVRRVHDAIENGVIRRIQQRVNLPLCSLSVRISSLVLVVYQSQLVCSVTSRLTEFLSYGCFNSCCKYSGQIQEGPCRVFNPFFHALIQRSAIRTEAIGPSADGNPVRTVNTVQITDNTLQM